MNKLKNIVKLDERVTSLDERVEVMARQFEKYGCVYRQNILDAKAAAKISNKTEEAFKLPKDGGFNIVCKVTPEGKILVNAAEIYAADTDELEKCVKQMEEMLNELASQQDLKDVLFLK